MLPSFLQSHNLTAYAFADLSGLSRAQLSRIQFGQRITAPVAIALARGVAKVDPNSDLADPHVWLYEQADRELAEVDVPLPAPVKVRSHGRRLTAAEVARIRGDARSAPKLAAELGVSVMTVWRVRRG